MTETLEVLIEHAKKVRMTEEQAREQRLSFAYGNTHIENTRVTRKMIADADRRIEEEERASAQG